MDKPLISIVLPTYKRTDYLERAIDSILAQTYSNYEIVIVDDNEIDSIYHDYVKRCIEQYNMNDTIKYIKTPGKLGGGNARNYGLNYCNGLYVAFLDDDDIFLQNKLEKQVAFMIKNNLDLSYHDVIWLNADGRIIEYRKMNYVKKYTRTELLRKHIMHSLTPTGLFMIKRDFLMKTSGFGDVIMGQDWMLMLDCIEKNAKIMYMPGVYINQYIHSGERISNGKNKILGERKLFFFKKKFFKILSISERRYVLFRHYVVYAFTYFRSDLYILAVMYFIFSFICFPLYSLNEANKYFFNRKGK